MDEVKSSAATTCPTCGVPVEVVSGDEGTCFYQPVNPPGRLDRATVPGRCTTEAEWAFADALLALHELGHAETAAMLARRWPGHEDVLAKAGVTGTLFGYPEFHRELRPSDLALGLIGKGSNGGQG